jgi:hypothetical protein
MRNQLLERSITTPAAQARNSSGGPEGGIRQYRVSVSGRIAAPPVQVYAVIADYRQHHPHIVPPEYFRRLDVLEGGVGAGTRTQIEMRVLGMTRVFEQVVSEPQRGRVLVETNQDGSAITTFIVQPANLGGYAADDHHGLHGSTSFRGYRGASRYVADVAAHLSTGTRAACGCRITVHYGMSEESAVAEVEFEHVETPGQKGTLAP